MQTEKLDELIRLINEAQYQAAQVRMDNSGINAALNVLAEIRQKQLVRHANQELKELKRQLKQMRQTF